MTTAEKLREMLIAFPKGEYVIETLEISHSLMSQTYYLTREPFGITATTENGDVVAFTGTSINMELNQTKEDLDQNFNFTFPDLNNVIDDELDRIPYDNQEPIVVIYRQYINTDLTWPAIFYNLNVTAVTQSKGVCGLACGVSQLNWRRTGITYNLTDFPMLRAII